MTKLVIALSALNHDNALEERKIGTPLFIVLPDNNRGDQALAPEDFFDDLHLFGPVALIPDLSSLLE